MEQLVAREGSDARGSGRSLDTGRRRAARRFEGLPTPTASPRPADVRGGLPLVPGADLDVQTPRPETVRPAPPAEDPPSRRGGLPPVPGRAPQASGPEVERASAARLAPAGRDRIALPETPAASVANPVPALPPRPGSSPVRRSGPVPPLPGTARAAKPPVVPQEEKPPRSPGRRRLVRSLVALAVVLGVVVIYHLGLYFYVDRSIGRVEALTPDGSEVIAPVLQARSETYLIVGTGVPDQEGPASVTTLLATVAPDAGRAVLLSLPPTALVDTPECRTADGGLRAPTSEPFAAALLDGGPSCLVRSVQQLSGLRVDHYLALDLGRLPGMVDALGGVSVCVTRAAAASVAAEPLPTGTSTVQADAVDGWLRPGDSGLDVTGSLVAERSQLLLTSTLRAAMTADTVADPLTLTRFLSRAAGALTVDEQTTLGDLRVLATTLGDLSGSAVQRAEVPVATVGHVPAGTDEAYVLLDQALSRDVFDSVIDSTRLPQEVLTKQAAAAAAASAAAEEAAAVESAAEEAPGDVPADEAAAPPLTVAPAEVTVDVLNGTPTTGLAASVAVLLRAEGFVVDDVGNEQGTVNGTVVRYGPGGEEKARTVAAAVPGAVMEPSDAIGDAVQLVLGPGYETVTAVTVPAPEADAGTGGEVPPAVQPAPVEPAPVAPPAPVSC